MGNFWDSPKEVDKIPVFRVFLTLKLQGISQTIFLWTIEHLGDFPFASDLFIGLK
jgi:hypothetical protein